MMTEKERKEGGDLWLKVFCPDARCLSEAEVASLPKEKREMAETEKGGIWLEVPVPKEAPEEAEGVSIPVRGATPEGKKGFWLKLFCPDDQCVTDEGTDLP
jgi:hypothetical protein